jgi:DNA polymerase
MEPVFFDGTFAGWKTAARGALKRGLSPHEAIWRSALDEQTDLELGDLLVAEPPAGAAVTTEFRVPKEFMATARRVSCHRDPTRWALLYRLVWRLNHGEPNLLSVVVDEDVHAFEEMDKAIRRDVHKMRAFVRFREVTTDNGPWFVAWFEPQHLIVELNAKFFVERFASMRWSILTPDACAHWAGAELSFTPGVTRAAAPAEDAKEDLWRTYYSSIFNPARVKIGAMKSEMAMHYWKNLPEARIIPDLIAQAPSRVDTMVTASEARRPAPEIFAAASVPATRDLSLLRDAAASCRACPLWQRATCTVFGEGPAKARILVVGEQPGDAEDRAGKPFVGPAGQLFNRALQEAGVNRGELYVTNAVKHFKWTPAGKRRLHAKPSAREVTACRPWLEAEIAAVQPELIVCLGGTAASSVMNRTVKVTAERGEWQASPFGVPVLFTLHPSALLRQPDAERAKQEYADFVADLAKLKNR